VGSQNRKVREGKHRSKIEGVEEFLIKMAAWTEIANIKPGRINYGSVVGRRHNKTSIVRQPPRGIGSGGGFQFRATRVELLGGRPIVRGRASYGTAYQDIFITPAQYIPLMVRLVKEGYLVDTEIIAKLVADGHMPPPEK
jgi:hypothetical protein